MKKISNYKSTVDPLDFTRLNDQRFEVESDRDFESVVQLMNDRFGGLPSFHQSVLLDVTGEHKCVSGERGKLQIPAQILALTEQHLKDDLHQLVDYINRGDGIKTLGILCFDIGLNREFAQQQLKEMGSRTPPLLRSVTRFFGSRVKVPIVLAVASRQTGDHYESLAVGIRGVTRYSSALVVKPHVCDGRYEVIGGLEAQVRREDIDHPISSLLVRFGETVLPRGFFNSYLQRYMVPERRRIVTRLCHYVFNGLKSVETDQSECTVVSRNSHWRLAG